MDARTFLGLEPTSDPLVWRMPVTLGVSTPGRFLFGGCGLAAGIATMEAVTGRPTVWATAQYLSFAPTGSILEIDVTIAVSGRQTTQARAVGRVDGQEILTVNAALGRRPSDESYTWAIRPNVPDPEKCPARDPIWGFGEGTLFERVEIRLAAGRQLSELDGSPGDGRSALWSRLPGQLEPSPAWLAVLGDYVPSGIGQALGVLGGGNSLDNTLRVVRLIPSEWVLCDIRIHAVAHGYGHGLAHLWAQDGSLLATASQSVVVRRWTADRGLGTTQGVGQ
jgi:acyl-CoA thioesterase II